MPHAPNQHRHVAAAAMLALAAGGAMMPAMAAVSDTDARLALLKPADQEIARSVNAFISRMEEKYFARMERMNGSTAIEILQRETDDTDYLVRVTRGEVVAKAGSMLAIGKKQQPGRSGGELLWSRFYSIDVHARTPLVGMLHATVVTQFYDNGSSFAGGWLGIMNGTRNAGDMAAIRALVDGHFARYGRDPTVYRKLMVKGTDETIAEFRRQPDEAGVSFYGPPVFPGDTARSFQFVSELFDSFVGGYLDLIERRAREPFTSADVAAKEAMEKRWLVDQLFSDPFASKLVPFEVWSLSNVPPSIRF
jgi:coproporphyrinogen III oxidase